MIFVKKKILLSDFEMKFVTKYLYEDSSTKQLVFVFCIETDCPIKTLEENVVSEQMWSNEQIVKIQNYSFEVFPEKVKKELKFLRIFSTFS